MIRSIEEIGNSLQYRSTSETYQEYIDRLEDIIKHWHTDHTTLLHDVKSKKIELKNLQKKYLKALEECDPQSIESHYLNGRCGAMIEVMKFFVDIER